MTRSSSSAAKSGADCARARPAPARPAASASAATARGMPRRPYLLMSEPLHDLLGVLDLRRLREAMADQLAPFGEVGGAPEVDGVALDRLPLHEQAIAARALDRALQLHPAAALGPAEQRRRLLHPSLELRFHSGLDVDLR